MHVRCRRSVLYCVSSVCPRHFGFDGRVPCVFVSFVCVLSFLIELTLTPSEAMESTPLQSLRGSAAALLTTEVVPRPRRHGGAARSPSDAAKPPEISGERPTASPKDPGSPGLGSVRAMREGREPLTALARQPDHIPIPTLDRSPASTMSGVSLTATVTIQP